MKQKNHPYRGSPEGRKKGYAILFTIILVSIISLIGIGLSNTTYKQLMLSSGAKASQLSFYESDMATECALYADNQGILNAQPPSSTFDCGIDKNGDPFSLKITYDSDYEDGDPIYYLDPNDSINNSADPCFRIKIIKHNNIENSLTETTISASGYNICNKNSPRTVERTIEVKY